MTLIADALAAYHAAARLLIHLTDLRIDLLAGAEDQLASGGTIDASGYRDVSDRFAVCVPDGNQLQLRSLRPGQPAVAIGSDFPEWLSLEGWLPSDCRAGRCVIEAEVLADRAIGAEVFVRTIGSDGAGIDEPPRPWRLDGRGTAVIELALDPAETRRRKIVILLRRPPTEITLRQLAMVPV